MLELLNVDKTYAGRRGQVAALQNVSLRLERGSLTALQGPSGCGKTTLLLAAGGLLAPDRGEVLIDGVSLYTLSPERRARLRAAAIGFVFQQFHLIPYLSLLDNLRVPALALGAAGAEEAARAESLAERFGLGPRRHHFPDELSTGERQRTALARALMNHPKLILADEPTGNLDADNAQAVLEALEHFAHEGGTVLLASHDARVAARGHRAWRMQAGCLESEHSEARIQESACCAAAPLQNEGVILTR